MAFFRSRLPAALLALVVAGAHDAGGTELLQMPMQCSVRDGAVTLTPSEEKSYRIYGQREHHIYTSCSPANPERCRNWKLHRFDVDCDGDRVPWLKIVEAASRNLRTRAWVQDGQMHVQMGPLWAVDEREKPLSKRRMWHKAWKAGDGDGESFDPTQAGPRSVVQLPAGFAPVLGFNAQFVADGSTQTAASETSAKNTPSEDTSAASASTPDDAAAADSPAEVVQKDAVPAPSDTPPAGDKASATGPVPLPLRKVAAAEPSASAPEPATAPVPKPTLDVPAASPQTEAAAIAAKRAEAQAEKAATTLEQAADKLERLAADQAATAIPAPESAPEPEQKTSEPAPVTAEAKAPEVAAPEPAQDAELDWGASTTVARDGADAVALLDEDASAGAEPGPDSLDLSDSSSDTNLATADVSSGGDALPSLDPITTGSIRVSGRLALSSDPIPVAMIVLTAFGLLLASITLLWTKRHRAQRTATVPAAGPAQKTIVDKETISSMTAPLAAAIERARASALRRQMAAARTSEAKQSAQPSTTGDTIVALPATLDEAYKIVGASPDTALDAVKTIADALRESWHPNLANSASDRRLHEERVRQIDAAWKMIRAARNPKR